MKALDWKSIDQDEQQILFLLAIIPPPVSLDNLIDLTVISPVKILKTLESLKRRKILSVYDALGSGYYHLTDPHFVQDVLGQINKKQCEDKSKKVISFFESHLEEGLRKWLMMTHLYQVSGLRPRQLERVLKSAEYCSSLGLRDDAVRYFRMVLTHLEGPRRSLKEKGLYIDATLGLIGLQGHLIPHSEQKILLKRSLQFAEECGHRERLVRIQLTYGQVLKTTGHYKKAAQFFDEGWCIAKTLGKEELLKKAALSTTNFLFWQGRVADAVERYEQVIGNLEEFPSDPAILRACAELGWCYGICGKTARGIGLIEAVRVKAEELTLKDVRIYADLMSALTLIDARRISEAEVYLSTLSEYPEEVLGHYALWAINGMMAYVELRHGNLAECLRRQKEAYRHSQEIGWPHHRGPYNFDYIDVLEENGMIFPPMSYDAELERMFGWPDIYMRGVAFRYSAMRRLKRHRPRPEIYKDLYSSVDFLTRAGAKLELSQAYILLARLMLEDGKTEEAQPLLIGAWDVVGDVNEDLFPVDLKQFIVEENQEELLVRTIVEVGNTLGTVRNERTLLEHIINLTMRFITAERGGFFLINGDRLELAASRNLDPTMVKADRFKTNFVIIEKVARSGKGFIEIALVGPQARHGAGDSSGFMICSPVTLQDRVMGVLYLDSRFPSRQLADKDLHLLTAIGNQVAIALDNVRAYEEIAELKDRLKDETRFYRMELELPPQLDRIVGQSRAVRSTLNQIRQVASTDSTALISGETGVGKELAARAIHNLSNRSEGPFIPVNIASLSGSVMESELFGHEKGAFTGASQVHRGRFELAHSGTLFLDDIENLTMDTQVKLLRILQEKEFERVGGSKTIRSNFRLIAATNQNIEDMVKKEIFRSDLYYRINVFPIRIPPLRERKDDIPLLASHFLEMYRNKMGKKIKGISENGISRLKSYRWPGNVRELQHVIERAVIITTGDTLNLPNLEQVTTHETREKENLTLKEMEKAYIIEVLEKCNWVVSGQTGAALILGLKPTTLYSKIKRLGIRREVKYSVLKSEYTVRETKKA